jgi:hypothetical protein
MDLCVDRAIAVENKWIAQRYGVEAAFATPVGAITVPNGRNGHAAAVVPRGDEVFAAERGRLTSGGTRLWRADQGELLLSLADEIIEMAAIWNVIARLA